MTDDRDLTANLPDEELNRIIHDQYTCFDDWHRRLAAELLELRAAQRPPLGPTEGMLRFVDRALWVDHGDGNLDGLTGELPIWADEWAWRIVDAVNDQSAALPPLGYVVGRQSVDGWVFRQFYGGPSDRAEAGGELTAAVDEDGPAAGWQLLEVREVQP